MEQDLRILLEHLKSPQVLVGFVLLSLKFSLFCLLYYYLSVCFFNFNSIISLFSIYEFDCPPGTFCLSFSIFFTAPNYPLSCLSVYLYCTFIFYHRIFYVTFFQYLESVYRFKIVLFPYNHIV